MRLKHLWIAACIKAARIKPFTALNERAICGAFLFPLLFSSPPFSSLVIKFEQNQMAGGYRERNGGREVSMKVPFVGLKRVSNLQNALPLYRGLKEERNQ